MMLRAVKAEAKLRRHGIARYNKRWRSWAQNRIRKYQLPLPVTLTSDTSLMGTQYIAACVQKAAALRKHDLKLWHGYSARILELKDELLPEHLGYILWGFGKSSFMDAQFYSEMMPVAKRQLPEFQSHALMALMWCVKRIKWDDRELLKLAARQALDSVDKLRPADFIKVSNALAVLGLSDAGTKAALTKLAIPKFEETFAQQFRDAVHPMSIACLWDDDVAVYLLERFRRVMITARPGHLMHAYESAVACRVLKPQVWHSLSPEAKQFYVRLSQRYIPVPSKDPSALHWDVSRHLADLGEPHRNGFRWGPYTIDVGLEELDQDERRRCIMVDGPSAFYFGSDQYLPRKRLQHRVLSSLGWDVRRVRWDDWIDLGMDVDRKQAFLRSLLEKQRATGQELRDRPESSREAVREKLRRLRDVLTEIQKAEEAREGPKIDFDV